MAPCPPNGLRLVLSHGFSDLCRSASSHPCDQLRCNGFDFFRSPQVRGVFPAGLQRRLGGEISITSFLWSHCNAGLYSFLGGRTSHAVYTLTNPVPPVQNLQFFLGGGWNYPSNGTYLIRLLNNSEIISTKQIDVQIQGTGPRNTRR
jgi:hypothetical protein